MTSAPRGCGALDETAGQHVSLSVPDATDNADEALARRLRVEIEDTRQVIDLVLAGLRYVSTDVALAYAELHAERGNVRPLAELKARRELRPPLAQRKPWTPEDLDRSRWREMHPPSPNVPPWHRFRGHDEFFRGVAT